MSYDLQNVFRRQIETWWRFNKDVVWLLVVMVLAIFAVYFLIVNENEKEYQKQVNICAGLAEVGAETTIIENRCFALSQSGDWYEVTPNYSSGSIIPIPVYQ